MTENTLRLAPPYDASDVERIRIGFSVALGHPVRFARVETAPDLIGGFRAVIDGQVYDASLSAQLDLLHSSME